MYTPRQNDSSTPIFYFYFQICELKNIMFFSNIPPIKTSSKTYKNRKNFINDILKKFQFMFLWCVKMIAPLLKSLVRRQLKFPKNFYELI